MSIKLWKVLLASPAVLGMGMATYAIAADAPSVDALEVSFEDSVELAQITSVNELTDVLPTDWAYTALQNLVETYGCIEGYPNRTFRGNQPLTRYEFAAGLNACLDVIAAVLAGGGDVPDLSTIQRLQEEFAAELATLRGRVDALEAEVAEIRSQQFSTTTRLRGQVDAHIVAPFDDLGEGEDSFTTFTTRARLNFDTSFTGDDRLRVRLQAGDDDFDILPAAGGLDDAADGGLDVEINDLYYQFPVGDRLDIEVAANSRSTDDFVSSTIVPFDGIAVANPSEPEFYDFDMDGGGFGVGLNFALTERIVIDAAYSADNNGSGPSSANPDSGGIFGSDEQAYIAQINYFSDRFDAAVAYLHGNDGGDDDFTDTFAGLVNVKFGNFFVAGHVAYSEDDGGNDDTSWQAGFGAYDFLIEGSEFGVYYADRPSYTNDPYIIEGYYALPVNKFLTITPALIYGDLDIDGTDADDNFYGAIRATFKY